MSGSGNAIAEPIPEQRDEPYTQPITLIGGFFDRHTVPIRLRPRERMIDAPPLPHRALPGGEDRGVWPRQ
jgi:hypothetical protein